MVFSGLSPVRLRFQGASLPCGATPLFALCSQFSRTPELFPFAGNGSSRERGSGPGRYPGLGCEGVPPFCFSHPLARDGVCFPMDAFLSQRRRLKLPQRIFKACFQPKLSKTANFGKGSPSRHSSASSRPDGLPSLMVSHQRRWFPTKLPSSVARRRRTALSKPSTPSPGDPPCRAIRAQERITHPCSLLPGVEKNSSGPAGLVGLALLVPCPLDLHSSEQTREHHKEDAVSYIHAGSPLGILSNLAGSVRRPCCTGVTPLDSDPV